MGIRFAHVNLVARDWKKMAVFYIEVFGCTPKPPERDLSGEWLDKATSLEEAHVRGIHLLLPGVDDVTIEIFRYDVMQENPFKTPNHEGFGHIAFAVEDVEGCVQKILDHGGGLVGTTVKTEIPGVGRIHFAYARDPEGNIIEIQKWQ